MKRSKFIQLAATSMATTTFLSFPAFSRTRQQEYTYSDFFIQHARDKNGEEQSILIKMGLGEDPDLKLPIYVGSLRDSGYGGKLGCTFVFNKISEPSSFGDFIRYRVSRNEEKTSCAPEEDTNRDINQKLKTTSYIDFKPRSGKPIPNSKYEMARLIDPSKNVIFELAYTHTLEEEDDCFLTTACVEHKGLPDDCDELQKLRAFRDNFMQNHPEGKELIADYYILAPAIVSELNKEPNDDIYDFIYNELVLKCIALIDNDKPELAMYYYKSFTEELSQRVLN